MANTRNGSVLSTAERLNDPPDVAPFAPSWIDRILSETPHPVEVRNRAPMVMSEMVASDAARTFERFTGRSSARFQSECCQLLIFQAREMCGYYAIECARPMVTSF